MKTLLPLSIVPLLLSCLDLVAAVRLGVHGRSSRREGNAVAAVQKRSNIYTDNGSGILTNSGDINYYSSLTLGGKNFTVLIDTGQPRFVPLSRSASRRC
jgi:uncharacterized heparinase superfamily protein